MMAPDAMSGSEPSMVGRVKIFVLATYEDFRLCCKVVVTCI